MNTWLLVGIAIIVVGFALKIDSFAVVIVAGFVTAIIGNMAELGFNGSAVAFLELLGEKFVSGRGTSIFILTLPIIGISERYGLREQAVAFIRKLSALTAGRVLWFYQVIRQSASALSLRLGGHAQFIRPLIHPMAEAAAAAEKDLSPEEIDTIKAASAAVDNYGNFFGQNLFLSSSGVIMIVSTLNEAGFIAVTNMQIAMWSIPVFVIVLVMGFIQLMLMDRKIKKGGK